MATPTLLGIVLKAECIVSIPSFLLPGFRHLALSFFFPDFFPSLPSTLVSTRSRVIKL